MCVKCNGTGAIYTHLGFGVKIDPCECVPEPPKKTDEELKRIRNRNIERLRVMIDQGLVTRQDANAVMCAEIF